MPRAQKLFEASGIKVLPVAVDFRTGIENITVMDFVPSAKAFNQTSFFVREMIGRIYSNLKYWMTNLFHNQGLTVVISIY